jgi:hypothetical protein
MRHPVPAQHDAIQRFFDLLASGIAHHNPLAICAVLLMLWIPFKILKAAAGLGAPPRYRGSGIPYSPPARLDPPRRPAAPPRPPRPARPQDRDGKPHPDYCPCRPCRDYYPAALAEWARPAETAVARMPEPSDDIAPVGGPCRHEHVRPVYVGGELMRYICANGWCDTRWAPAAKFPAGVLLGVPIDEED